jgi:hypothetical protein
MNELDIKKTFYEQFSINQNHHHQLFIQFISVLGTVLLGYGYVYTSGGQLDAGKITTPNYLMAFILPIATLINTYGLVMICNMALGYRKDQYIISRINKEQNLFEYQNAANYIFPSSYDPAWSMKDKIQIWTNAKTNKLSKILVFPWLWRYLNHKLCWMPNFHNFHFLILVLIQVVLFISFITNPFDQVTLFEIEKAIYWPYVFATAIWILLTTFAFERSNSFSKRLIKTIYNIP